MRKYVDTNLTGRTPVKGETIMDKIARAKRHGEMIKDTAEIVYTPRSAGVVFGHDIRDDKWAVRAAAKTTIDVDKLDVRKKIMFKAQGLNEDGSPPEPAA